MLPSVACGGWLGDWSHLLGWFYLRATDELELGKIGTLCHGSRHLSGDPARIADIFNR